MTPVTIEAADPYDPAHLGVAFVVCSDWNALVYRAGLQHGAGSHRARAVRLRHRAERPVSPGGQERLSVLGADRHGLYQILLEYPDERERAGWRRAVSGPARLGGRVWQPGADRHDDHHGPAVGCNLVKPTPTTADVQNVVITRLNETQTSNQDYIKYDPNPDSEYHTPTISFTVRDKGDYAGHTYQYQIFLQPTWASGRELLYKDQVIKWLVDDVDMASGSPVTKPVPWNGTIRQSSLLADRGTYTYDVQINEYDEAGNLIDLFAYKWSRIV